MRPSQFPQIKSLVGFELVTAMIMKTSVFWYIIPCGLLEVNGYFGGRYRLHLQARIVNQVRKKV
jgi:hypothetical protein